MQIVDFGASTFEEQLRSVHGAAGLVGVSGSDLINGIFLPRQGAVLEILPTNRGHQVCRMPFGRVPQDPVPSETMTLEGHCRVQHWQLP